jgi:hypothetical protein
MTGPQTRSYAAVSGRPTDAGGFDYSVARQRESNITNMAKNRPARFLLGVALLALAGSIIAFNVININEAFGDGPPYYGRTTNMDKWFNPLPVLATVDSLGVLVIAACIYFMRRRR